MIRLSAFADEISADPEQQIEVLRREGIRGIDLRSAWNTNVLDLSDEGVAELRDRLSEAGIAVEAIGSPIGKTPIDGPFDLELRRLDRAIELAHRFGTRTIRIFSFYGPSLGAAAPEDYRDEVFARLHSLIERAREGDVLLLHENEKDIYGDTVARCLDLYRTLCGPHFGAIFDPANFIQCGETPYPAAYDALKDWIVAVHVKDATADGRVVPAGEGIAEFPALLGRLRADGFDGVLSLEPHLAEAGQYGGWSGDELFGVASQALQGILHSLSWPYA